MRRLIISVALALALAACVAPSQPGRSSQPGVFGSGTDAADLGDGRWIVSCALLSACTWRAQQVCGGAFEVTETNTTQSVSGAISPYGGGFGTRTDYQINVRCRK